MSVGTGAYVEEGRGKKEEDRRSNTAANIIEAHGRGALSVPRRLEYTPITRNAIGYRSALSATGWALTHIGVRLLKNNKREPVSPAQGHFLQ